MVTQCEGLLKLECSKNKEKKRVDTAGTFVFEAFRRYYFSKRKFRRMEGFLREHEDINAAIQHHADTVARVCALYFRNRPEGDDAFQDTFLKYAQSDKQFESDEHRKAWLISVATNTCKDMLRKAESKTVLMDQFDDAMKPSWQSGIVADDRADRLNEVLQQIDEKYRIVLYMKYYEGYAVAEIAAMLNMQENTVYTNLTRGRKKLKEILSSD